MQLHNETALAARLYRGALHDSVNGAWVVARGCFRRTRRGMELQDNPWPIFDAPLATDFGTLPSDLDPMRAGVSVFCLGTVRNDTPRPSTLCSLQVGDTARQLRVHGRRSWVRLNDRWSPGPAEPFTELPLSWSHCPGGVARFEGREVPHGSNPEGTGFVLDEAELARVEVPRIEDVRAVIDDWRRLPAPMCWAPLEDARTLHVPAVVAAATRDGVIDPDALARGMAALPCLDAPPETQFASLPAGSLVDAQLGDHGLRIRIPGHDLRLHLQVGSESIRQGLWLSSVWLLVDEGLTVLTWRARTAYAIRPGELRSARLVGAVEGPR